MSSQAGAGLKWACPECGRDYRIPSGTRPPKVCEQCVRRRRKSRERERKPEPQTAPAVKEQKQPSKVTPAGTQVFVPTDATEPKGDSPTFGTPDTVLPPEVESQIARQERQQLLRDVANISRTMTFFRRLVMAMVVVMALNMIVMGGAFLYSMKSLQSLNGAGLNGGGGNAQGVQPGGGALGNPFEQLKEIQQNMGKINEIIRDLEK